MATAIWVNTGPGNGLLPDGTKPLPESMLTYHQHIVQWYPSESNFTRDTPAINHWIKLENYFPEANELIRTFRFQYYKGSFGRDILTLGKEESLPLLVVSIMADDNQGSGTSAAIVITVTSRGHPGVSNHLLHSLFNRLFRRTSAKTSKLRAPGLCEGNTDRWFPLTNDQ